MGELERVTEGIWTARAGQRFYGIEVGARMTVIALEGGLLVHSPIALPVESVAGLGELRWVLAPNLLHHLYVGPWIDAGAEAWCGVGLPDKRPDLHFTGVIESRSEPFGPELLVVPMRGLDLTRELIVLHRPSRTLIVTDLVFNLSPSTPPLSRLGLRMIGGYPGVRTTLLEKAAIDRALGREAIDELLALDFDRLIMAHGEVVERGAQEALARAFAWLR